MNRAARRKARRSTRPGVRVPPREALLAVVHGKGVAPEMRALARTWLRFPETTASNIVARSNALTRRRAANKRARQSRKVNR
jgi:hypothetical protein